MKIACIQLSSGENYQSNFKDIVKYIISTTFKPVEVFIVAGGIYLFMTFIIHNVIKYLEKKYGFQT